MKVQTFQPSTAAKGPGNPPCPEKPEPEAEHNRVDDTFEHVGYAIGAGLISGLCISTWGDGVGSLAGIAASAAAVATVEGLRHGSKGETGNLPLLGGAVAGGAFASVSCVGALLGGFAGHPVLGGALAGALAGAASYLNDKR